LFPSAFVLGSAPERDSSAFSTSRANARSGRSFTDAGNKPISFTRLSACVQLFSSILPRYNFPFALNAVYAYVIIIHAFLSLVQLHITLDARFCKSVRLSPLSQFNLYRL
jgi:hypothetical protein